MSFSHPPEVSRKQLLDMYNSEEGRNNQLNLVAFMVGLLIGGLLVWVSAEDQLRNTNPSGQFVPIRSTVVGSTTYMTAGVATTSFLQP